MGVTKGYIDIYIFFAMDTMFLQLQRIPLRSDVDRDGFHDAVHPRPRPPAGGAFFVVIRRRRGGTAGGRVGGTLATLELLLRTGVRVVPGGIGHLGARVELVVADFLPRVCAHVMPGCRRGREGEPGLSLAARFAVFAAGVLGWFGTTETGANGGEEGAFRRQVLEKRGAGGHRAANDCGVDFHDADDALLTG